MIGVLKKGLKTLKKHVALHKSQLEADEATDKEIYHDQAVMDSKEQHENAAANSNNDTDDDSDTPLKPPLSCHEALQAKITIEKYIETIDEPYAHKLERILVDFACSTQLIDLESQKMKASLLTDYFTFK